MFLLLIYDDSFVYYHLYEHLESQWWAGDKVNLPPKRSSREILREDKLREHGDV